MFYSAVELALGHRRELTPDEIESRKAVSEVEEAIASGDENWIDKLNNSFGTPDFMAMLDEPEILDGITNQLDNYGN